MNTGQIVKGKRTHDFAIIPNEISQSKDLTMEEKGMLCFLLSLPESWVLYKKNLYNQMPDGKHAVDRVFKSLQEKGYVLSCRQIDARTGRLEGWNHIVYDSPQLDRDADLPISGFPVLGETRQSENIDIYKETNIYKETITYKYAFEDRTLAVEGMGNHKSGRERKYWKDPVRYLRDRRWEDETQTKAIKQTPIQDDGNKW